MGVKFEVIMQILCIIDSIGSGGAQRQLVGLADLLKRKGQEVEVVYYHDVHFFRPFLQERGIKYQYLPETSSRWQKFIRLKKYIDAKKPNVVIAYLDGPAIMCCMQRMLGKKFKLLVSERSLTEYVDWKRKVKFWLYRFSDFVVANSHAEEQNLKKRFPFLKSKIRCVTNFVDTDYFSPSSSCRGPETLRILCVARISPEKNVLRFIQTVEMLRGKGYDLRVDWFGHADNESYYKQCLDLCQCYNLQNIFSFNEASVQILEEYHKADVLCLPSLYEGCSNVICEAMSCGLPIVCSDVGDNGWFVKEGVNGFLFDPNSEEDMYKAFESFCKLSHEARKEMGLRNREVALEVFSKETFVNQYVQMLL